MSTDFEKMAHLGFVEREAFMRAELQRDEPLVVEMLDFLDNWVKRRAEMPCPECKGTKCSEKAGNVEAIEDALRCFATFLASFVRWEDNEVATRVYTWLAVSFQNYLQDARTNYFRHGIDKMRKQQGDGK